MGRTITTVDRGDGTFVRQAAHDDADVDPVELCDHAHPGQLDAEHCPAAMAATPAYR